MKRGFTLLEVMVALAILASVVVTVLGAVNFHLGLIEQETELSQLTLLARDKFAQLEQAAVSEEDTGSFAPLYPSIEWRSEVAPGELTGALSLLKLQKWTLRVKNKESKREVVFVRYIAPKTRL